MKYAFATIAVLGLSACLDSGGSTGGGSGGGGGGVDLTPDAPSTTMNAEFGALLNGVRTAANDLTYSPEIGRAVQIHANDMYTRDYTSIEVLGETNSMGAQKDIGDLVTEQGYIWTSISQQVAQGELTLVQALDLFDDEVCVPGLSLTCVNDDFKEDFGIAKAGSGSDTRWAFVIAEPSP